MLFTHKLHMGGGRPYCTRRPATAPQTPTRRADSQAEDRMHRHGIGATLLSLLSQHGPCSIASGEGDEHQGKQQHTYSAAIVQHVASWSNLATFIIG